MKLEIDVYKVRPEITVEHNGEKIDFSASVFQRKAFKDFDVFDEINRYWAQLPPHTQNEIWHIYKEVSRGFDQILSSDELFDHLQTCIRALAGHHPLNVLETWLSMDPANVVPSDILESFVESRDSTYTREKTYVAKDYMELVTLSMFLRTLAPIFGEYIESIRRKTGMDHKEYAALQLLTGTSVLESDAVKKLSVYIDQITKEKHKNPERILSGISSEDMGFFLLALVIVRRLCLGEIKGRPGDHLVSKVFNFLYQKVFNPSKTNLPIREKTFGSDSDGNDQNKRSILESYRKRTEISIGEIAGFEYGYEDIHYTAQRLAPGITEEEVNKAIATAEALKGERLGDPQLIMMSWVFKTVHSSRSVYYVNKQLAWKNLAVLEAVLWHWGHRYLSILATSHKVLGQETMYISPIDNRGQIPLELQEKLSKHYPYIWTSSRRAGQPNAAEPNPVIYAIDLVTDELISNAWRSTASEEKIVEVFGEMRRKLPIFPSIKSELAKLIIDIEERR